MNVLLVNCLVDKLDRRGVELSEHHIGDFLDQNTVNRDASSSLDDYNFVIWHCQKHDEDFELFEGVLRKWHAEDETNLQRVVLFSTGRTGWENRKAKLILAKGTANLSQIDQVIYNSNFPVLHQSKITELNWNAVANEFSGSAVELVEILSGQGDENLQALCILCQGFLVSVTYYDPNNDYYPAAMDAPNSDELPVQKKIVDVLSKIGWVKAMESSSISNKEIAAKVTEKAGVVRSRKYWWTGLGVSSKESVQTIRGHVIRQLANASFTEEQSKHVDELLDHIENLPDEGKMDTLLVANALDSLFDRLSPK